LDPTCTAYLQSLSFNEAFWFRTKLASSINFHYYTSKYAKSSSKDERWEKTIFHLKWSHGSGFSHLLNFPAHPDSPPIPSADLLQVVGS